MRGQPNPEKIISCKSCNVSFHPKSNHQFYCSYKCCFKNSYYSNHERNIAKVVRWQNRNIDIIKLQRKAKAYDLKVEVIKHYSNGTNKCVCCGENSIVFLTIDHIKPSKKGFKEPYFTGAPLHSWLIKNYFPLGFQVLCYNCNSAKSDNECCPHEAAARSFELVVNGRTEKIS